MVRINLITPRRLADQHLVAEYDEILMLFGHARKYPDAKNIPDAFTLGKGHITFFKNKLRYLQRRHEAVKKEMRRRGFKTEKSVELGGFPRRMLNDWRPSAADKRIVAARIASKIRLKPRYYRYCGEYRPSAFFLKLLYNK